MRLEFDKSVRIAFGETGRCRIVTSVSEAKRCLRSEKWPTRNGPFTQMAAKALDGASVGQVTPAEARQAFADAALEAHVLVLANRID